MKKIFLAALTMTIILLAAGIALYKSTPVQASVYLRAQTKGARPVSEAETPAPFRVINDLTGRFSVLLSAPGWVYVREESVYESDLNNYGILPDGSIIPLKQVIETWAHIDEQGRSFEGVTVMSDANGQVIQVSTYKDNTAVNLSTGETFMHTPEAIGLMDYGLNADIAAFIAANNQQPAFSRDDAQKIVTVAWQETYQEPLNIVEFKLPVQSLRTVAVLDDISGQIISIDKIATFTDGSERTISRLLVTMKFDEEPPQDVIKYLEGDKP